MPWRSTTALADLRASISATIALAVRSAAVCPGIVGGELGLVGLEEAADDQGSSSRVGKCIRWKIAISNPLDAFWKLAIRLDEFLDGCPGFIEGNE